MRVPLRNVALCSAQGILKEGFQGSPLWPPALLDTVASSPFIGPDRPSCGAALFPPKTCTHHTPTVQHTEARPQPPYGLL